MRSLYQLLLTLLLNASWQVPVVTISAACCSWLLRGSAAWCRHSVWVGAIVISLCLPVISGLNAIELSSTPKQELGRLEPERVLRPSGSQEINLAEPKTTPMQIAVVEPKPSRSWNTPISLNQNLAAALVALYALFLSYRGCKLLQAWRRTKAIMRGNYSTRISERGAAIVAKCQTAIGVKRARVVWSASVPVPVTAGVINPLIILPEKLLTEADEEILLSAIGHELVHVARRDYILNLIYELIYLPVSFHPAAALLRRRIKQTRELCCDDVVTKKLLAPEVYARSLVRLVGSVPLAGRLAPDITIGIADADILEVRIMSLLKTSKLSARRNSLLLIAAGVLLAVPCVAAAAFALQFDIDRPEVAISQPQYQRQEASQKQERAREELRRAREELQRRAHEFEERVRRNPNAQGAELEARRRMQRELEEASARLGQELEAQHVREADEGVRQLQERLAQLLTSRPIDEARMRELREQLDQLQRSLPGDEARSRELREQLAMVEKQYPNAALMAEQLQSLRRAQEELAREQATLTQEQEALAREKRARMDGEKLEGAARQLEEEQRQHQRAQEMMEAEERAGKSQIRNKEYEEQVQKDIEKQVRMEIDEAGRAGRAKEQAELTQLAIMPMDRAIQIATSQNPGKVLSCSLGRQKDGQVFYRLVIINGQGDKTSSTHVWVSATDGRILRTEHE